MATAPGRVTVIPVLSAVPVLFAVLFAVRGQLLTGSGRVSCASTAVRPGR